MNSRRVVITGLGLITPLGHGIQNNWNALIQGKSGIDRITHFDASTFSCQIAGEVKNFKPEEYIPFKEIRRMDPFTQYGVAAAKMAILDSGIQVNEQNATQIGVFIGSGIGGIQSIEKTYRSFMEKGPKGIGTFFIPQAIANLVSGHVSIFHGLKGPNSCVVTACATGAHAIGDSTRLIQSNKADVMVAGGAEAAVCELGIGGFSSMRALSTRNEAPQIASRPFDRDRDGFVMGEGAGIVVLEEYEHAKKRGAKIYAEVIGYAMTADASHMTNPAPQGEGAARCMKLALQDAKITPKEVHYINAHGTSTEAGDVAETQAIKAVFKEDAKKVSVSSTKSMTGHLLGAAGSIEAIYSILALQHGVIPPTINLDNPDPLCDLDYTPFKARERKITVAMSNSFGFGGTNAVLIFRKTS